MPLQFTFLVYPPTCFYLPAAFLPSLAPAYLYWYHGLSSVQSYRWRGGAARLLRWRALPLYATYAILAALVEKTGGRAGRRFRRFPQDRAGGALWWEAARAATASVMPACGCRNTLLLCGTFLAAATAVVYHRVRLRCGSPSLTRACQATPTPSGAHVLLSAGLPWRAWAGNLLPSEHRVCVPTWRRAGGVIPEKRNTSSTS